VYRARRAPALGHRLGLGRQRGLDNAPTAPTS
jgi:hypothetical protein